MKNTIVEVEEFLSDKFEHLKSIIDLDKRIYLIANPGTGKTTFISELANQYVADGQRIIFSVGLKAIPQQVAPKFNEWDLVCHAGNKEYEKRKTNKGIVLRDSDKKLASTIQQLCKLIPQLTEKDLLVIDEAHMLITWANDAGIQKARIAIKNAKCKVVLISGTPFEVDFGRLSLNNVVHVVEKKKSRTTIINYKIEHRARLLDAAGNLCWHLIKNLRQKMVFVYNNNKAENLALKTYFDSVGIKSCLIDKDHYQEDYYLSLLKNEVVDTKYEVVLCTKSIQYGINVQNEAPAHSIVVGRMPHFEIKQFGKRFRTTMKSTDGNFVHHLVQNISKHDKILTQEALDIIEKSNTHMNYNYHELNGLERDNRFLRGLLVNKKTRQVNVEIVPYINEVLLSQLIEFEDLVQSYDGYNDIQAVYDPHSLTETPKIGISEIALGINLDKKTFINQFEKYLRNDIVHLKKIHHFLITIHKTHSYVFGGLLHQLSAFPLESIVLSDEEIRTFTYACINFEKNIASYFQLVRCIEELGVADNILQLIAWEKLMKGDYENQSYKNWIGILGYRKELDINLRLFKKSPIVAMTNYINKRYDNEGYIHLKSLKSVIKKAFPAKEIDKITRSDSQFKLFILSFMELGVQQKKRTKVYLDKHLKNYGEDYSSVKIYFPKTRDTAMLVNKILDTEYL